MTKDEILKRLKEEKVCYDGTCNSNDQELPGHCMLEDPSICSCMCDIYGKPVPSCSDEYYGSVDAAKEALESLGMPKRGGGQGDD